MSDDKQFCALCGLPVAVPGFVLKTQAGEKHFCCEGCLVMYEMLNEENLLPKPDTDSTPK